MDNQEQLEACAPNIREAVRSLLPRENQYLRKDDIDLAGSADQGPWLPSQTVRDYLPNIDMMEVRILDETTDLNCILEEIATQRNVGLVLMGRNVTRAKRPALIVLSTEEAFYVIDPDFRDGIEFLDRCLKDERLSVWTTNGLNEACCLLEHFNISLKDSRARDCLGLHLHLMKLLNCLKIGNSTTRYIDKYPSRAVAHSRYTGLRLESFDKLIEIWLQIDKSDSVLIPINQLPHLYQRPLNLTAINLIKKRCSLVLRLAQSLMQHINLERDLINKNVLKLFTSMKEQRAFEQMRQYITRQEANRKLSLIYYAHLDGDSEDEKY